MPNKKVFIERRVPQNDFAVRLANSKRASAVAKTQGEAIQTGKKMHPDATILAERVRHRTSGNPDKWRAT